MRARYQQGCMKLAPRKSGDVWEYRYRLEGKPKTIVVGSLKQLKTESAAWKQVELLRLNINAVTPTNGPAMTFSVLAGHYAQHEMPMDDHSEKAYSTKDTNRGYLRKWIEPKWGDRRLSEITTIGVESWLKNLTREVKRGDKVVRLPLAAGSKAKIRNLMSSIYRHAMRHGFAEKNPIQLVRQSSKRKKVPIVLSVEQLKGLLDALPLRERTMVLLDGGSGLRRGELFGLQWGDVDWESNKVLVQRSIVKQVVGKVKTEVSEKPMPLDELMMAALMAWYSITPYKDKDQFIFATDAKRAGDKRGKQPLWPNKVMDYHIKPVAKKLGIEGIGWHTFRHTFATLLAAHGENVKTVQELLRHASAKVTQDTYIQASMPLKHEAQSRIVRMFAVGGNA